MNKLMISGLVAAVLASSAVFVHASPAVPQRLSFQNANGATFQGHLKGDEWFSWVETQDGYVVVKNPSSQNYEYARLKGRVLVPSGIVVSANLASGSQNALPADLAKANSKEFLQFLRDRPRPDQRPQSAPKPALKPGEGRDHGDFSVWNHLQAPPLSIPLLVVILEFTDQQLRSPVASWNQKIFGSAPGQMNHFWQTASAGKFRFTPATETEGTANDGIVKVRLPIKHPNHGQSVGTSERYQALDQLDGHINFASFDKNGDKVLTKEELQIIYLYAGGESATGSSLPSVWAHKTGDFEHFRDGVELRNNYSRFGERHFSPPNDHDATFGIIAHELGHGAFDLPDLYDYDGSSGGADSFCLMSSGNWGSGPNEDAGTSPVPPSAWVRYRLGFAEFQAVTPGTPLQQTLKPLSHNGSVTLIPTNKREEYFLVENRYPDGYDKSLAAYGRGALIWHIDESRYGNDDDARRLADYENNSSTGQVYWPKGAISSFGPSSTPNSNANDGSATGVVVSNLELLGDSDYSIKFQAEKKVPTTYATMYFRGTPNNWGSTAMSAVAANTWETLQTFAAGTPNPRFKFDVNANWATNFGDTNRDGKLEANGGDIPITRSGTYKIRLNDKTMTYTVTASNRAPIANAGGDKITTVNELVTISAEASSDPDGSIVAYKWSNGLSGKVITVEFDTVGSYTLTLTVTDDLGATATDTVVIKVNPADLNKPPLAQIKPLVGARVNQAVNFDGSGSSDPDGQIVDYKWLIGGLGVTLTGAKPSYTFKTAGSYPVTLTVTDNKGAKDSTSTTLKVDPAGFKQSYPQVYYRGTTNGWAADKQLQLVGDNLWSIDVDVPSTELHAFKFDIYGNWTVNFGDSNNDGIGDPHGSNIAFPAGGGTYQISFNDVNKRYQVIRKSSMNKPPVAVVEPTQAVTGAPTLLLDGNASYDTDGVIASYLWTQLSGPTLKINQANQALANVTLPRVTQTTLYRFRLTVTDNNGASSSADQTVTQIPDVACTAANNQMYLRGTYNNWGTSAMNLGPDCVWQIDATFGDSDSERFKFDVYGDWSYNFGDNNRDGIVEQTGNDIPITLGAGSYTIRFNDMTHRYSVSKR